MGIYDEVQTEIKDAMNNELADSVRTVQFITYTNVYNPTTMQNVLTEVPTDVEVIKINDYEAEVIDESTLEDAIKYFVLDSDRNGVDFETDMKIQDGTDIYKLKAFKADPAKASWTIFARKWS